MRSSRILPVLVLSINWICAAPQALYRVLPGEHRARQPFDTVILTRGPSADDRFSWELSLKLRPNDAQCLLTLRIESRRDLFPGPLQPHDIVSYRLLVPRSKVPLQYRRAEDRSVLLPPWKNFTRLFLPVPARGTAYRWGFPQTCELLGHVLSLQAVTDSPWRKWRETRVLELQTEILVGTGRTFRDTEGRRLPQKPKRQDYTYVPFSIEDYKRMIEAGMNYFGVAEGCGDFLRTQPVFWRASAARLDFPADLYRSNYLGPVMFMDEPTCIMIGDKTVQTTLRYFSDAAALIRKRVRSLSRRTRRALAEQLQKRGISLGDMVLEGPAVPTWETRYETAFYQLEGGAGGIVHEGRYRLDRFNRFLKASTGISRPFTAEEMLRYHFAVLRGAARHFGCNWGTSIYGQADPAISPIALTLAYDMGARYLWFWTSDHEHHLPWPEQLKLSKILKRHRMLNPRGTPASKTVVRDKLILIPYGYFLVLESPTGRRDPEDLWWIRRLDPQGKNPSSRRYRRLMEAAFKEIRRALEAGEDFDIAVDDGRPVRNYRSVVELKLP